MQSVGLPQPEGTRAVMAYRRTERVEEHLAERRHRILAAAQRIVSEQGFAEAQIAAVAARAGIATGTVYRYFPSKAELFAEVVGATSEREVAIVAAIASGDEPVPVRLAAAVQAFTRRATRGRRLAYAMIAEPVDPAIDDARLVYRRALGDVFVLLVSQGVASGDFPAQDVQNSAACIVGACLEGLVGPLAPEAGSIRDGGAALASSIARFCLRAVGCDAARVEAVTAGVQDG